MEKNISIIVHGGAGRIHDKAGHKNGVLKAVKTGWKTLEKGGSSLDAVEKAVNSLENDPVFNSGYGSCLNLLGKIEVDAAIMDSNGNLGACGAVNSIKNPVSFAKMIMQRTDHVLLCGKGADIIAERFGFKRENLKTKLQKDRYIRALEKIKKDEFKFFTKIKDFIDMMDTVGACAIDKNGIITVGVSTGGIRLKLPGRVGDTPLPGTGFYVGKNGGVVATGHGEAVIKTMAAYNIYLGIQSSPQKAIDDFLSNKKYKKNEYGFIAIGKNGSVAKGYSTPEMSWASIKNGEIEVFE